MHWMGLIAECRWQEIISELECRQTELTQSEQQREYAKKKQKKTEP